MSVAPDILVKRRLVRGFQILRQDPRHVYELLPNWQRRDQEQVIAFLREATPFIDFGPVDSPPALPAIVILVRGTPLLQGFLGNDLPPGVPEALGYDEERVGEAFGTASASGKSGQGRMVLEPMQATGGTASSILFDTADLAPGDLENQEYTLHVVKGRGAGQIRAVDSNGRHEIAIIGAWDKDQIPDGTSWFSVRAAPPDFDGEPVRSYPTTRPGVYHERLGGRHRQVLDLEVADKSREMTIALSYLVMAILYVGTVDLEARGLQDLSCDMAALERRPAYFPDSAFARVVTVTCEFDFVVVNEINTPTSFEAKIRAGGVDNPIVVVTGDLGTDPGE